MRPTWMLAALAALIAGSAFAQTKIPPSHLYTSQPPAGLDKNYGLPKMTTPEPELPQQKTAAPKPQDQPDSFKGLSTYARPEAQPSDPPDFFQDSPGIAALGTQASDVPNFFEASPDTGLPNAQKSRSAYSTTDTPLFTTTEGPSTGDAPTDNAFAGDTLTGGPMQGDAKLPDGAATR
jgi:hypothetical protein